MSNKRPSGVRVPGSSCCLIGLILLTQRRVLGQGLGTTLVWGQGDGVYPKKSLQWTRGLVNERDDVLVTI